MGLFDFFKKKAPCTIIKEIPIKNIDDDAAPFIRVFNDGTSFLLTEWFREDCAITEKMLTQDVAKTLNIEITREDKDRFVINTNDDKLLTQFIDYINTHK